MAADSTPSSFSQERLRLSILIPVFDEETTVEELLNRVGAANTEALGFEKEIIVCDDGSKDDTLQRAQAAAACRPWIQVLAHSVNRGKSAAIRTALAAASGDYCLIQDADLEYDVGDYPALLSAVKAGADAVYGSRFLHRKYPTGMKLRNYVANRLLTLVANWLYGISITDEATCFKLIKTDLLRDLSLECDGFDFCPEVSAKLGLRRVRIVEVPVHYAARAVHHGKKVRWTDGVRALRILVRYRWRA